MSNFCEILTISAFIHMQQSQRSKEHSSLAVMMVLLMLLRLLATTTQDGTNWTTCNQFVEIIVQSSMVIKFMSSEEMEQGKT